MTTIESTNHDMYQTIADDASITVIEKQFGRTSVYDITDALDEYKRLFIAGVASDAEIATLARAYPKIIDYQNAYNTIKNEPIVVGGPASVELIDREGHLITTNALKTAFDKYMSNFRTRNTMVLHSDVQVGWALPAYITKSGQVFKSGVDEKGLFFITEIRNDTRIANKVLEQINDGKLKSYSIAGSATKTQQMEKGLMPYMQVDEMELAEITVCEKGVNQAAGFNILKGTDAVTHTCTDGSCVMDTITPKEPLELLLKEDGNINFTDTFKVWFAKNSKNNNVDIEKFLPLLGTAAKLAGKAGALGAKATVGGAQTAAKGVKGVAEGIKNLPKPLASKKDADLEKFAGVLGDAVKATTDKIPKVLASRKDSDLEKNEDHEESLSLLVKFLAKTHHSPQLLYTSLTESKEIPKEFAARKEGEGSPDQTEQDSADAFTLQDKETEVVFQKKTDGQNLASKQQKVFEQVTRDYNKDEDIEKQDDELVTEYSTPQIQRDAGMISADSNVPSTPSMGWFDMLKQEIKTDVLTDIAMPKSYPDWQQDKESYAEHREIIKNKITEGYK